MLKPYHSLYKLWGHINRVFSTRPQWDGGTFCIRIHKVGVLTAGQSFYLTIFIFLVLFKSLGYLQITLSLWRVFGFFSILPLESQATDSQYWPHEVTNLEAIYVIILSIDILRYRISHITAASNTTNHNIVQKVQ